MADKPISSETSSGRAVVHARRRSSISGLAEENQGVCSGTNRRVDLERAVPQGINSKILLLKLIEVRPTGAAGNIVTTHHVRYDEDPAQVEYTEVTIEGAFSIPVHHVVHA